MKLAIVGSRNADPTKRKQLMMASIVNSILDGGRVDEFVSGGAGGVDYMAEQVASDWHQLGERAKLVVFKADWDAHGRAAGPIRNTQIVTYCHKVIAFWDFKSKGTRDTINKAVKADKILAIVHINTLKETY